jgi:hypothetical protein
LNRRSESSRVEIVELLDELLRLAEEFDKQGVEYALCGGLAMNVHGFTRGTIDIDFLVLEASLPQAKIAASAAGFDFETGWIPISDKSAPRVLRLLKIDGSEYLTLDLLLANSDLNEVWSGRLRSSLAGKSLTVVSKEGLIRMKSTSTRDKDRMDVKSLVGESGGNL